MKRCPYCKEAIQDDAIKCKHCGSKIPKSGGSGTLVFIIFIIAFIAAIGIPKHEKTASRSQKTIEEKSTSYMKTAKKPEDLIDYEVFSGEANICQILVSKNTNKDDVIKLAKYLWEKYKSEKTIMISIFNNREALTKRFDPSYPEEKILRHYLIEIKKGCSPEIEGVWWWRDGEQQKIY